MDSASFYYEPTLVSIDFTSRDVGWIYGAIPTKFAYGEPLRTVSRLWATTNAGKSWQKVDVASLGASSDIFTVGSHGDRAYLLGTNDDGGAFVSTTTVGSNEWTRMPAAGLQMPAGGTSLQAAFVFGGSRTWVVAGNDRGMTMSDELSSGGRWVKWPLPCSASGFSMTVPVALSRSHLIAECDIGGYSATVPPGSPRGAVSGSAWLYQSTNGGRSYQPLRAVGGVKPQPFYFLYAGTGLPAMPTPTTIICAAPVGSQRLENLIESTDSGRSWKTVFTGNVLSVEFPSAATGVAIAQLGSSESDLFVTNDQGRRWVATGFTS